MEPSCESIEAFIKHVLEAVDSCTCCIQWKYLGIVGEAFVAFPGTHAKQVPWLQQHHKRCKPCNSTEFLLSWESIPALVPYSAGVGALLGKPSFCGMLLTQKQYFGLLELHKSYTFCWFANFLEVSDSYTCCTYWKRLGIVGKVCH